MVSVKYKYGSYIQELQEPPFNMYIMVRVLRAMPNKKTRVMYSANISHTQLEKLLSQAEQCGLAYHAIGVYITTKKGDDFLAKFKELCDIAGYSVKTNLKYMNLGYSNWCR